MFHRTGREGSKEEHSNNTESERKAQQTRTAEDKGHPQVHQPFIGPKTIKGNDGP